MRFLPYSTRPGRLLTQLFSDVAVAIWTTIWVFVGLAVHGAVSAIAEVGRQVKDGADGISDNLNSAGDSAHKIPLVGDKVGGPLRAASEAAGDLAGAGHNLDTTATWLAVVLAIAVAAPPILAFAGPWIFLRIRFFRRKLIAVQLAATPTGEQLLALRALANRPLNKLTVVTADPVAAWRAQDTASIRGLAAVELKAAGIGPPKTWRTT
ncbi:hypothetical protein [Mycobacteroides sp. LB1]|uniref:hypothetical protein n=1 Tax=Mycobacteroides sp. LB1 TaxID=2750814 RepID=UPI0015DE5B85|nr:hypothetical protein [Mycobacteroides sp. LB1]